MTTGVPGASGGIAPAPGASLRLPGEHFAAALVFLTLGAVGVVWVAPELTAGVYLSPRVAGVTHLFTLGWLTMTIFGATYQLLPVALGAPVTSEQMGHVSFATFAPGVALFVLGVMNEAVVLHHAGIALLTIGIVLQVTNVALSLPRAKRRDVTSHAVGIAEGFLSLTLVLGVVLLHNLHSGFLAAARLRALAMHLHVALLGWVFVMIIGMSHRLLPMFLISHGAETRWSARALALMVPGVVILAAGLAWGVVVLKWTGLGLIEGGVACFLMQAWSFLRSRARRNLDAGLKHAAAALAALAATALLAPVVLILGAPNPRLATVYVVLGLLGAFTLYVIGLFYKVVPFLAWLARYRDKMGREKVPTVAQLYSSRIAHADLILYVVGVLGLVGGIATVQPLVTRCSAVVLLVAVGLFVGQMIRVAWGPPLAVAAVPLAGIRK